MSRTDGQMLAPPLVASWPSLSVQNKLAVQLMIPLMAYWLPDKSAELIAGLTAQSVAEITDDG